MAKGTIKTVIADKGFGFITPEGARPGDKDIFFHRSAVSGGLRFETLRQNEAVEFEVEDGQRGPNAKNVRPAAAEMEAQEDEMATEDVMGSEELEDDSEDLPMAA